MSRHRPGRRALGIACAALVLSLAVPGLASADTTGTSIPPAASNGATITLGPAALVRKVAAQVTLHVTCEPLLDVTYWDTGETVPTETHLWVDGFVQVYQAAGKSIASGGGEFGGYAVCDGVTDNAFVVTLVSGSVPFHGGTIVAGASMSAFAINGQPANPPFDDEASTGALTARLR